MQNLVATLTERERELLHHLVTGASNQQIADHLCLALQTVKFHLANIYKKLGVKTRAGAVAYAMQDGEITAPTVLPVGKGFTEDDIRKAAASLVERGCGDRKVVNAVVMDLLAALGGRL